MDTSTLQVRTAQVALAATVLAAGALAAACSSSGNGGAVEAAFISRANAVCQPAVSQREAETMPVPSFDPTNPPASELPAIGAYFASPSPTAVAAQLVALGSPKKDATDWQRLMTLINSVASNAQAQVAAAKRSDVAGFVATVHTAQSLSHRVDSVGKKVGFSSNSACAKVFG